MKTRQGMAPEKFRKRWGFAGVAAAPLTLLSAVPALAQGVSASAMAGSAPIAIAVGAGGFALLAMLIVRSLKAQSKIDRERASDQISSLRALLDIYEALMSGTQEVTVLWAENTEAPRFLGQISAILPVGRKPESLMNFDSWLTGTSAEALANHVSQLRVNGHGFAISLQARDGRLIRANGWVLGDAAAMRLRPAFSQTDAPSAPADAPSIPDISGARAVLAMWGKPAFLRDQSGKLVYANPAYLTLARALGKSGDASRPAELLGADQAQQAFATLRGRDDAGQTADHLARPA
ncbi:hypothetical protein PSQ19_15695 [Devosia algicola]|uniref:PAS domain-containing protein n=1 Tax=Devosia algicola TaxID=3026418 RepID=A0ABY7YLC6_9HYPH|nr:hypothetical protein [Devosia algicola]WDR02096.1 hypothetical protein PSQ19_15695 [Devosia algicola]